MSGGAIKITNNANLMVRYCSFSKNEAKFEGNSIYACKRIISDDNVFNGVKMWTSKDMVFRK